MQKLLVITGEVSGDIHAGHLARELKQINPELRIFGTGGPVLEEAGAELFYRVEQLAVIGFSEVVKVYRFIKRVFNEMVAKLDEERPDAVLLVDYPAFNLRFAAEAKKRGIKVIYYVAPKVWAWKKDRVNTIREVVDELIVLFPFEVSFFQAENVTAHCFGNPLLDTVKPTRTRDEFRQSCSVESDKILIALLPGSRKNELSRHMPLLIDTVKRLVAQKKGLRFICPLASEEDKKTLETTYAGDLDQVILVANDTYNTIAHSDFALVASGTAALETAILETPNFIFYKSSLATYLIGKYVVRIKAIGLPNIIADRIVVPENPRFTSPEKMAEDVLDYLNHPEKIERLKRNLNEVKRKLGESGAYRNTAAYLSQLTDG